MPGTRVLVDCEQLEKSRVGTHHWNTHNLHRKVLFVLTLTLVPNPYLYIPRQSLGKET
jgi:hypothetical protein